jgi:ribosome maturation factor RimP
MKKVTERVAELARPIVEKHGLELWNVELIKEAGQLYLRVYIDREGVISTEDCEVVSRELDPLLDELDPIEESYIFEVSSAGAERALKRPSDFERFMGSNVAVHLYRAKNGKKEYVGRLTTYNNGDLVIEVNGAPVSFKKDEVALVRLRISL